MKSNKIILAVLILSMIALIFSGCGGGGGNPVVPPGDEVTLEEEYNTITQIGGSAAEEFLNFESTYGEEQALQKTVDYLNQQEGIENVSLDEESGNISFEFENGHLGTIITYDVTKSSKLDAGKGELPFPIERIKHLSKGTPTKEKALLLNPFPSIFVGNSAQYIKGKLEAIGYQCDYYEGEEVTVELMKNMEDYGVIYIDTHGGVVNTHYGKEVDFVIGQKGSKQLYEQYDSDLMLHRLGHVWIPSLSLSHYFCILPHFIGKYAETSYPNSLIYIDACNSYKNPTMAEAFKDEGAYVYCGYSSLILAFNYSERKVFDNMIDETMTIQEAVDEVGASNLHFHPEDREDFCLVEPNEDKIEDVIHKYYQATNDRDWDEARSCCVYGSTIYNQINETEENLLYDDDWVDIDLNFYESILEIIINGDYAEVNLNLNVEAIPIGSDEVYQDSVEVLLYLQKINSNWKLYDSFSDDVLDFPLIDDEESTVTVYINIINDEWFYDIYVDGIYQGITDVSGNRKLTNIPIGVHYFEAYDDSWDLYGSVTQYITSGENYVNIHVY